MPDDTHPRSTRFGAQRLFMQSLYPMLIIDSDGRYVDANTAACLLLRTSRAEILKLTPRDLTPPERMDQFEALHEAFGRDGYATGSYTLLAPDGARIPTDFSAIANIEPGRHLGVFVLAMHDPVPPAAPAAADPTPGAHRPLTERERQVLSYVALGQTSGAIAESLFIAPTTVETHIANALRKLGAKTRAHAIAIALRSALLDSSQVGTDPPGIQR